MSQPEKDDIDDLPLIDEMPLTLPLAPPGMVTIPAPAGFSGHIFVPDPDGWLSAKAISQWLRKGIPQELEEEVWLYQEAYARGHMVQFQIKDSHGRKVLIDDKALRSLTYPNICAQIIVDHTEGLIGKARDKKKSPGP